MSLSVISRAHLARLDKESKGKDRAFFKKMSARMHNENPLFGVLVDAIAASVKTERTLADGAPSPEDLHRLIVETGMLCFRALELAALDGNQNAVSRALMEDPIMDTLETPALEARVETMLIVNRMPNEPGKT